MHFKGSQEPPWCHESVFSLKVVYGLHYTSAPLIFCCDMAKLYNYRNYAFKNTDFDVIYYCFTMQQLNHFFSFASKLLTVRILTISLHLLISTFTQTKKSKLFMKSEM